MNIPFSKIEPLHYIDADTGRIMETVMMKAFYEWDAKNKKYVKVREYEAKARKPNADD